MPRPFVYQAQFEEWVPAAVDRVFLFFANPGNLPRIMPEATKTQLIRVNLIPPPGTASETATVASREPLAGAGSEIATSFRILPFLPLRAEWVARITEFEWNHHFADVQKQGPFKRFQHRHEFTLETRRGVNGTVVRDVIEYEIGWGLLGCLAEHLFVRRQLQHTFAYRQRALVNLLGAA